MRQQVRGKRMGEVVVLIRGGGEMATGVAHRLARAHFKVCITEVPQPLAVRRAVSFCEAVYEGIHQVEGLTARRVDHLDEIYQAWREETIPVLVDPEAKIKEQLRPAVLVDAILAKRNLGTEINHASLVIGLGPGFVAGKDAHMVIETNRGHDLGRVLVEGKAEADTGIPAPVQGYSRERVLHAQVPGVCTHSKQIGDPVRSGEVVATVDGHPVKAEIDGVVRGLIRPGIWVAQGTKIGDVDPQGVRGRCYTISDKARAIGGGVLEGILIFFNR